MARAQALGLIRGAAMAEEDRGFVRAESGAAAAVARPASWIAGNYLDAALFSVGSRRRGPRPDRPWAVDGPLTVYQNLFAPGVSGAGGHALTVEGELKSGRFELPGDVSSQFITGLLLALPRLAGDSEIVVTTPLESRACGN
ncbi:MAG: hypothetical protein ACLUI3_16760 [Christensenellales bacterium]